MNVAYIKIKLGFLWLTHFHLAMILQKENFFILLDKSMKVMTAKILITCGGFLLKEMVSFWSFSIFNAVFIFTANSSESPTRHSDYVVTGQ